MLTVDLDGSSAAALPPIYQYGSVQNSPGDAPHLPGLSLAQQSAAPTAQMVPSPLMMAASAANELQAMMPSTSMTMEPELGVSNAGISDKFFHPQGRPPAGWHSGTIDPLLQDSGREPSVGQEAFANRAAAYPRPIAMNPNTTPTHFTTDFSLNQKPAKPKVRGRFSDSRRKEVQEVRKRGACIRCRMLKKPVRGR